MIKGAHMEATLDILGRGLPNAGSDDAGKCNAKGFYAPNPIYLLNSYKLTFILGFVGGSVEWDHQPCKSECFQKVPIGNLEILGDGQGVFLKYYC